ncbi:hypothetical protein AMELA_G00171010 [Ameiurus melas]|uniref:Uncharacterized protein n=1 Tax=Ameiurus melas TaxID=219545 RepID=A0A7J6AC21_AMEME|nr:hypothetical protein AMELA_G00171010 [Ameiurus melas]
MLMCKDNSDNGVGEEEAGSSVCYSSKTQPTHTPRARAPTRIFFGINAQASLLKRRPPHRTTATNQGKRYPPPSAYIRDTYDWLVSL